MFPAMLIVLSAARAAPDGDALAAHAPTVPDLRVAEGRLRSLLATSRAAGIAAARLQVAWTEKAPAGLAANASCDAEVLALGWRVERFGAAWREAAQALRVQAARVREMQLAPTVAPLVDARWSSRLGALAEGATTQERAFLEAGAWQATWVRPALDRCPAAPPAPAPGIPSLEARVRDEPAPAAAILGVGDGWICVPGHAPARADDALVVVPAGPDGTPRACWSGEPRCDCTPGPVLPGALVGAPVEPAESPAGP